MNEFHFNKEVAEHLFISLFKNHSDKSIAEYSELHGKSLANSLLNVLDNKIQFEPVTNPTTEGFGYLNNIKKIQQEDKTMYFAKISFITGKESSKEDDKLRYRFQYIEVLMSKKLSSFAEKIVCHGLGPLEKELFKFKFSNLYFEPKVYEQKAFINTKGFLNSIEMG